MELKADCHCDELTVVIHKMKDEFLHRYTLVNGIANQVLAKLRRESDRLNKSPQAVEIICFELERLAMAIPEAESENPLVIEYRQKTNTMFSFKSPGV